MAYLTGARSVPRDLGSLTGLVQCLPGCLLPVGFVMVVVHSTLWLARAGRGRFLVNGLVVVGV